MLSEKTGKVICALKRQAKLQKQMFIVPSRLSVAPMMDGTGSLNFPYYSEGFATG
jgi:hypothetical protein